MRKCVWFLRNQKKEDSFGLSNVQSWTFSYEFTRKIVWTYMLGHICRKSAWDWWWLLRGSHHQSHAHFHCRLITIRKLGRRVFESLLIRNGSIDLHELCRYKSFSFVRTKTRRDSVKSDPNKDQIQVQIVIWEWQKTISGLEIWVHNYIAPSDF